LGGGPIKAKLEEDEERKGEGKRGRRDVKEQRGRLKVYDQREDRVSRGFRTDLVRFGRDESGIGNKLRWGRCQPQGKNNITTRKKGGKARRVLSTAAFQTFCNLRTNKSKGKETGARGGKHERAMGRVIKMKGQMDLEIKASKRRDWGVV